MPASAAACCAASSCSVQQCCSQRWKSTRAASSGRPRPPPDPRDPEALRARIASRRRAAPRVHTRSRNRRGRGCSRPPAAPGRKPKSSLSAATFAVHTASRSMCSFIGTEAARASTRARTSPGAAAYSGSSSGRRYTGELKRREAGKYGEFWIGVTGATACSGLTSSSPAPCAALQRTSSARSAKSPIPQALRSAYSWAIHPHSRRSGSGSWSGATISNASATALPAT